MVNDVTQSVIPAVLRAPGRAALALCALLLASPAVARADQGGALSIDDLTRRAGTVVEGRVTSIRGAWNSTRTQIETTVTLEVSRALKGDRATGPMQLVLLGGTVGDITMHVVGQPTFRHDERVLLFLRPNHGLWRRPSVGGARGKLSVYVDPANGREFLLGESRLYDKSAVETEIESIMRRVR